MALTMALAMALVLATVLAMALAVVLAMASVMLWQWPGRLVFQLVLVRDLALALKGAFTEAL